MQVQSTQKGYYLYKKIPQKEGIILSLYILLQDGNTVTTIIPLISQLSQLITRKNINKTNNSA